MFVEVKTRATDAYGDPSLAVTPLKQRRLRRLAAIWLHTADTCAVDSRSDVRFDIRFDVVSVLGVKVRVIEAAF